MEQQVKRQARILHIGLAAAAVFTLGTFGLVRRMAGLAALEGTAALALSLAALATAVLAFGATAALARRLERSPAEDEEAWGRRALSTLVTLWAIAEAAVLVAGVAWLLTDRLWLVAVAAAGLLLLFAYAPDRRLG